MFISIHWRLQKNLAIAYVTKSKNNFTIYRSLQLYFTRSVMNIFRLTQEFSSSDYHKSHRSIIPNVFHFELKIILFRAVVSIAELGHCALVLVMLKFRFYY